MTRGREDKEEIKDMNKEYKRRKLKDKRIRK